MARNAGGSTRKKLHPCTEKRQQREIWACTLLARMPIDKEEAAAFGEQFLTLGRESVVSRLVSFDRASAVGRYENSE